VLVIGHRGAAGLEPENTLRAVRRAIEVGVDGVEVDVRQVDGELVLFHDSTVERTTDGRGSLAVYDFPSLRGLDAGQGERVPTLRELLECVAARVCINIELKDTGIATEVKAALQAALARQPQWRGRLLLSAFDEAETSALGPAEPGLWKVGVLFRGGGDEAIERARAIGAWSIHPSCEQVNPAFVRRAREAGLEVLVYTVNDPGEVHRMLRLGVGGLFSDFPDRLLAALR